MDLYPVFKEFIISSRDVMKIISEVNLDINEDVRMMVEDVKLISDSLRTINDTYLQRVLASYDINISQASQILEGIPTFKDEYKYAAKYVDIYISNLKLKSLRLLEMYMSEQQLQTYKVAKDTMKYCGSDFMNLYLKKMQAAQSLRDNHSTLMS